MAQKNAEIMRGNVGKTLGKSENAMMPEHAVETCGEYGTHNPPPLLDGPWCALEEEDNPVAKWSMPK